MRSFYIHISTFHKADIFSEGEDLTIRLKNEKTLTLKDKDVFVGNEYTTNITSTIKKKNSKSYARVYCLIVALTGIIYIWFFKLLESFRI